MISKNLPGAHIEPSAPPAHYSRERLVRFRIMVDYRMAELNDSISRVSNTQTKFRFFVGAQVGVEGTCLLQDIAPVQCCSTTPRHLDDFAVSDHPKRATESGHRDGKIDDVSGYHGSCRILLHHAKSPFQPTGKKLHVTV